jgi:hypothetical protein
VFNAIFSNISAKSWQHFLDVQEAGDIASDKQGTFVALCSKYSLTVSTVYLYNKGD